MVRILINGNEIDFDGTIPYRMLNPMFNDKVSHSYNIKISNTPRNKDVISQLHLPEIGYSKIRFDAIVITDAFSFRGAMYINSVTDRFIDFQFNAQNDFWNLANVDLNTLVSTFDAMYFPIKNSTFMNNFPLFGKGYSGWINTMEDSIYELPGFKKNNKTTAPLPSLKLNTIISDIFNSLNFKVVQNCLVNHYDTNQLYLYNSNCNASYRFTDIIWQRTALFRKIKITEGRYNIYDDDFNHDLPDGCYLLFKTIEYHHPNGGGVVPGYNAIKEQLDGKVFPATVTGDRSITIDIEAPIESFEIIEYDNEDPRKVYVNFVVYTPIYDGHSNESPSNHVPEIKSGEFLKEIEKLLGCRMFIDESSRECQILFLKDIIKENIVTDISGYTGTILNQPLNCMDGYEFEFESPSGDERWGARIKELTPEMIIKDPVATKDNLPMDGQHNDIRLVIDENAWYLYHNVYFMRNQGWDFFCENILNIKIGKGEFSISSKFSPMLTEKVSVAGKENEIMYDFTFLSVEKPGSLLILNQSNKDDFRLFFYRGLKNHQIWAYHQFRVVQIPLCNNNVYDQNGVKITEANLSLRWDSEYGIYNQFYKEYFDLLLNKYREATFYINWPEHMLNSFAWWKKYRINHQNYLVKSIEMEISNLGTRMKNSVLIPI